MVEGPKRCKGFNERDYMLFNSTLKFDDRCNNFIHTNSDGQDVTVVIPAALKIRMPFWDWVLTNDGCFLMSLLGIFSMDPET